MLTHEKPADVREEKAALRVVGIGRRFGVLVMDAMIAHPHVDRVLHGDAVREHEKDAKRARGAIAAMRPQTMDARRHSESADEMVETGEDDRVETKSMEDRDAVECESVQNRHDCDVSPYD